VKRPGPSLGAVAARGGAGTGPSPTAPVLGQRPRPGISPSPRVPAACGNRGSLFYFGKGHGVHHPFCNPPCWQLSHHPHASQPGARAAAHPLIPRPVPTVPPVPSCVSLASLGVLCGTQRCAEVCGCCRPRALVHVPPGWARCVAFTLRLDLHHGVRGGHVGLQSPKISISLCWDMSFSLGTHRQVSPQPALGGGSMRCHSSPGHEFPPQARSQPLGTSLTQHLHLSLGQLGRGPPRAGLWHPSPLPLGGATGGCDSNGGWG